MDPQTATQKTFTVFVNSAIPIGEVMDALVRATGCRMGNVDVPWQSLKSRNSAPPCFSVKAEMKLTSYICDLPTDEAIAFAGQHEGGTYQPATAHELVTFLTTFVKEQLEFPQYPVVALGEPGDECGPIVAYAYMAGNQRMLFISRPTPNCKWEAGCRFLIVKK